MKKDIYTGLTSDQYAKIKEKYDIFLGRLSDVNNEPATVYKPLPQKALDDIKLIREISRNLQLKKDEDVRKTQQDKEEKLREAERLKEAEKAKEAEEKQEEGKEN